MADKVLIHDISYWQGDLTKYWQLFKDKGCKAIIIQSSNGLAYQKYFLYAAETAKEKGFLVGSYHYYRQRIQNSEGTWYTCKPLLQAQNYFNWVTKCGVEMDLPPALDIEEGNNPYLSASSIFETLGYIEKLFKRTPIVYSRENILRNKTNEYWKRFPLWLANYNPESMVVVSAPWDKWDIWQYSQSLFYTPAGTTLKKAIDHNWFNGDEVKLYELCYAEEGGTVPIPIEKFVRVKLTMKSDYLRFRNRPLLYPGTTLVVGRGDILKLLTPEKIPEDIEYWHVEMDGYAGYVSAGSAYTELV